MCFCVNKVESNVKRSSFLKSEENRVLKKNRILVLLPPRYKMEALEVFVHVKSRCCRVYFNEDEESIRTPSSVTFVCEMFKLSRAYS